MKIQFGLYPKDLSDFLEGKTVTYQGATLDNYNFVIIECEHKEIVITDKEKPSLRRNIPEKEIRDLDIKIL